MTAKFAPPNVAPGSSRLVVALVALVIGTGDGSPGLTREASLPANDYTFVLRDRAGPYHYWRTLSAGGAYVDAVDAFGRPTSRGSDAPDSNLCTVRWETVGVDIGFAWSTAPCRGASLRRSAWGGMRLFGRQWRTAKGLEVGDPVSRIRSVYARARWVSRPPRPGEWWLTTQSRKELGVHPLLVAEVGAGRVIAIRVPAPVF